MLIEAFRMCRQVKVSCQVVEVTWEGRGLLFSKYYSIFTSLCCLHAFSYLSFTPVPLDFSHLCHWIHPPYFFLCVIILTFLYFGFPPVTLVPFMFQSLDYPWDRGHPLQGGFSGNMKGAGRWAESLCFLCFIYILHNPPRLLPDSLGRQWGGAGVAAPDFKLLDGSVSCFPPVWTMSMLVRNADV